MPCSFYSIRSVIKSLCLTALYLWTDVNAQDLSKDAQTVLASEETNVEAFLKEGMLHTAKSVVDKFMSLQLKPIDRLKDAYLIIPSQSGGSILTDQDGSRLLTLYGVHNLTVAFNPMGEKSTLSVFSRLGLAGWNAKPIFDSMLHTTSVRNINDVIPSMAIMLVNTGTKIDEFHSSDEFCWKSYTIRLTKLLSYVAEDEIPADSNPLGPGPAASGELRMKVQILNSTTTFGNTDTKVATKQDYVDDFDIEFSKRIILVVDAIDADHENIDKFRERISIARMAKEGRFVDMMNLLGRVALNEPVVMGQGLLIGTTYTIMGTVAAFFPLFGGWIIAPILWVIGGLFYLAPFSISPFGLLCIPCWWIF